MQASKLDNLSMLIYRIVLITLSCSFIAYVGLEYKLSILAYLVVLGFLFMQKVERNWVRIVTPIFFMIFVYILWCYEVLHVSGKSNDSLIFALFLPIYVVAVSFPLSTYTSIIFSSLLAVIILNSIFQDELEHFLKQEQVKTEKILRRPAVGHKQRCKVIYDLNLGYKREPNCINHKIDYKFNDKVISRFYLNTDEFGNRLIPSVANSSGKLIFIGGSRTFGDGVSDNETYPFYLSNLTGQRGEMWALSSWGAGQITYLINSSFEQLKEITKSESLTIIYHAIPGHIFRTSGAYFQTIFYNSNYPKFNASSNKLEYLGTLSNYSFSKYVAYSWVYHFCKKRCALAHRLGGSVEDYMEHIHFIENKLSQLPDAQFVIVVHPGEYGRELNELVDFSKEFKDSSIVTVLDASELFEVESPFVIHPILDTHLSAEGNRKLAHFIFYEYFKKE